MSVALALLSALVANRVVHAAEGDAAASEPVVARLIDPADAAAVNLSMIDQKLALSLAAEIHVQLQLLDCAAARIQDPELKRLVQAKRQLYHSLFNTLNDMTSGRVAATLDEANGDAPPPGAPGVFEVKGTVKRGIRGVIKNVTHAAMLRVRMEIADQYVEIMQSRIEADSPMAFDRNFMAVDLVNQMQAVAILRVFEQQASDDFAAIIRVARDAAEDHLQESNELAGRLAAEAVASGTPAVATKTHATGVHRTGVDAR